MRADDERHVSVTPLPDGMAQVRGSLPATAGAVFDKRLSEMATSVCAKDSRTIAQRRADALSALCEGRTLACDCGQPDCAARANASESAAGGVQTVINVIATEATVTGDSDQPGYLEGYGVIDAEQVRELADTATIRPVECPTVSEDEALRYQPSAALERWIRCRDMTCRFPGCDRKAAICDLDHTTPFNQADPSLGGLTVPWDLACYCREHHRRRTLCLQLLRLYGWKGDGQRFRREVAAEGGEPNRRDAGAVHSRSVLRGCDDIIGNATWLVPKSERRTGSAILGRP